ncbi:MAG: VIT domain-containing protein, partial [Vicinamibacterales bacterium]
GETGDVWVRPGQLRWEDGPSRYRIADGSTLWRIDEEANRASAEDSPFFSGGDEIDLLELLALDVGREHLLTKLPTGRVNRDGTEYHVYRMNLPREDGTLEIVALVEVDTNRLRSIEARRRLGETTSTVGRIRVLAYNPPVDDEKFHVAEHLSEDGRIGKIADTQGIVTLRPAVARRWTPVARQMLIKPGDWLRTDVRGANAVAVTLTSGGRVTLGPGSLVEFLSPKKLELVHGEVQVESAKDAAIELVATKDESLTIDDKRILRRDDDKLVPVKAVPLWLAGFEGTATKESLGSLIAQVDGRDVPLTVGYHKVSVDIRDQIARTTIEESFVNHTDRQLEGVFYFPLPQDASISGFGMWIGGDLIEADVVEKQRAREIYETILRERRDPGLLEWTGGNLFKARVFPIFPHSEKRIKITYTQVLPLRGNRYRYSYGLQSEMLRQNPLRELSLNVTVHSAVPLKSVECPTHTVRQELTDHSARVEFTAQEYVPQRDFEVVMEIDGRQSDV